MTAFEWLEFWEGHVRTLTGEGLMTGEECECAMTELFTLETEIR